MKLENIYEKNDLVNVYLPMIIGGALMALGQNLFIMPAGLLSGGITGLSLIANYSFGFNAGITYFILNIPMVILAILKLKPKFVVQSFLVVLVFTLVQIYTSGLIGILNVEDLIINSIFGGLLRGLGAGIVYRNGASALGTDVLGALAKKNFNINIGTLNMALDIVILSFSSIMYSFQVVFYTIISQYILAKVADSIMQGVGERKNIMIVTKEYEIIRDEIYKSINRGVTFIDAEGGFSRDPIKVVFCVVSNRQISKIRHIMETYDKDAFMTITDSSEVKGKGFKSLGQWAILLR